MGKLSKAIVLLVFLFAISNAVALVESPKLVNSVIEPSQPLLPNSSFVLSNNPRLVGIGYGSFEDVSNGGFESGWTTDWNGFKQSVPGPATLTNQLSSVNCPSGSFCGKINFNGSGNDTRQHIMLMSTFFSTFDLVKFQVTSNPGVPCTPKTLQVCFSPDTLPLGVSKEAACKTPGSPQSALFPDSNTSTDGIFSGVIDVNGNGIFESIHNGNIVEVNAMVPLNQQNSPWDQNARFIITVNDSNTACNGGGDVNGFIDNVQKATAINTTTYPTNADCNASFNSSSFSPMAYNSSTGNYEIDFTAPLTSGDYNYAVSCRHGSLTDYDEGLLDVRPVSKLCVPVINNGDPDEKIDVVFIGSGFSDLNTFSSIIPDFIDYNGTGVGLMSVEPFNNDANKSRFNFWKVNSLQTVNADRSIQNFETGFIGWSNCSFADQLVLLSVLPRFRSFSPDIPLFYPQSHVYIGKEYLQNCYDAGGSCTDPWPLDLNWSNLNDPNCQGLGALPICNQMGSSKNGVVRTFVHEFGHAFGGLGDEYDDKIDVNNNSFPWDDLLMPPNCAYAPCDKWADIPSATCGDYNGCFFDNWIRPYDKTIMYSQFETYDFREVNERQLNRQMENFSGSTGGNSNFSYLLDLNVTDGNISLEGVNIIEGPSPNNISRPDTNYSLELISDGNSLLYDSNFNFPETIRYAPLEEWFDDDGNQIASDDTLESLSSSRALVIVPYSNIAKTIDVFDSNENLVLEVDVSNLSPANIILGYGGEKLPGVDYNLTYSLTPQPLTKLTGTDVNIFIGWSFYDE